LTLDTLIPKAAGIMADRLRVVEKLKACKERLVESQQVARLEYYVLDVATGMRASSKILGDFFGIGDDYRRD
jgi:hypothetical protein